MKLLALLLCLSLQGSLYAGTTLSTRERKKNFERNASLVLQIREALGISEENEKNPLERVVSDVQGMYRTGDRANLEKTMRLAEGDLQYSARKLSEKMLLLLETGIPPREVNILEWEKNSPKPLDPSKREKLLLYLGMAKSEKSAGEKEFISGWYAASLASYKRSLTYAFLVDKELGIEPKEELRHAANLWLEPITSKKNRKSSLREP